MKKRFLGILLALCMVLAFVPATAFAADTAVTVTDAADLAAAVAAGGTVKLGDDIDITSTLEINGKVTLDLNGHVLKMTEYRRVITITGSGDLTLTDGNSAATHTDTSLPVGGVITGGYASYGAGVYVGSEGKFTMKGGTISNCWADVVGGGGVYNDGTFTMEGGTISNCKTGFSGGGVYNDGTFTMEGGTISGCTVNLGNGGGVCNRGTFTMEGGTISNCKTVYSNGDGVYNANRGTLKNTSTTGGATICYDELVNSGSIEGKLVKFYNGDDLYAWEIVPENAKAVKPADPQKSGYVLEGWYKENTFDNKWDFDNDTVSADMQLYANWEEEIITLTVPFTTTVALGDVGKPGETEFDLAIVQTSMPEEYDTRVTVSGTLTTNGDGSYDGILTLTGPSEELRDMLCEGAIVQQVNGGEANWTYDDTVWGLLLYNGAMNADLNDDQEQAPAMQISIYPATCENTDDGPYYKLDWEAVYACQTVDEMTFTNTYTAHEYALNHDTAGHWDECPCGDVQNQEAHQFGEWTETKAPTHTANGEKERVCSVCDYTETAEVDELAHAYNLNHDTDGHWRECTCGDVKNQEAHKFGEWTETKAPTHTAKGEKERVCSVCDYVETAEVDELAHAYNLNHDTAGHWDECPCGDVQNQEAHKFGEWTETKAPTHTAKGEKERVCSVCDYVETAEIPMLEKTDVPQTGDNSHMALWFALLFVSGGLLTVAGVYGKKRKYSAK